LGLPSSTLDACIAFERRRLFPLSPIWSSNHHFNDLVVRKSRALPVASDNIAGEGIRSLIEYHTQAQRTPSAAFMSSRKSAFNVIFGVAANPHPD